MFGLAPQPQQLSAGHPGGRSWVGVEEGRKGGGGGGGTWFPELTCRLRQLKVVSSSVAVDSNSCISHT